MENLPVKLKQSKKKKKLTLCDDYHKDAMAGKNAVTEDDDDWDDYDEEDDGHVIYVRD